MKPTLSSALVALGLAFVGTMVLAQDATPRIDKRQQRQQQRIDQGVASGELNAREAHRLQRQQGAVQAAEDKAKADGVVTAAERRHINKMQNQTSRNVHKQKHDRQAAGGARP